MQRETSLNPNHHIIISLLTLSAQDFIGSFNCSCAEGYFGPQCQFEFNECLPSPCLNGGACQDLVNIYSCNCSDGFVVRVLPLEPRKSGHTRECVLISAVSC